MAFIDPSTQVTGYKVKASDWNALVNNWKFITTAAGLLELEVGGLKKDISAITKGDLISASAAGVVALRGVGGDGTFLEAASGESTGLKWGTGLKLATGTYSGNGATSQAITGVGFLPLMVQITHRQTVDETNLPAVLWTTDQIIDDNASGGSIYQSNSAQFRTNEIISLDADGFTVDADGADRDPNTNGITYNYMVWG